ncbi:MAG: hypothetical protein H2069_00495 [Legionella sp.]|nr:hypothetical protein [Legionella sp.]
MIKRSIITCLSFLTCSAFACTNAVPTDNPGFCASFKSSAICYCKEASGIAGKLTCKSMNVIYTLMKSRYGSISSACAAQHYTSQQECIDGWHCYYNGGVDSLGRACSSTGVACE